MQNKIGEVRLVSKGGKELAKRVIYMTCRDRGASLAVTFSFKRNSLGEDDAFNPHSLVKKLRKRFEWVTVKKVATNYTWRGNRFYTKYSIHFSSEMIEKIGKKVKELNGIVFPVRNYVGKTDRVIYYNIEISILEDMNLKDVYKGWVIDKL